MKKTALLGLMTLSLGGVAQAQNTFTEVTATSGEYLWNTAANWSVEIPAGTSSPTNDATIFSDGVGAYAHAVIKNYTAQAGKLTLQGGGNSTDLGGNLTVKADGVFNVRIISAAKNSRLFNYGDINMTSSYTFTSNSAQAENYGTFDIGVNFNINKTATFHMLGGELTAVGNLVSGTASGQKLNVHGGIMNFTDTNAFDVGTAGNLTIDFDNDGVLVFDLDTDAARYAALSGLITTAIGAGNITYQGGAYDSANMTLDSANNTIRLAAIPEPGTYALLAGLLGLISVMLRRRSS